MTRPRTTAAVLQELADSGEKADPAQAAETLRDALARGTNVVVAQAAELAARLALTRLAPELTAAFDRFCGERMRADKYCRAKVAVVKALRQLGCDDVRPYVFGMTCYWPSRPRPGGNDEAAELRIAAAEAFAELGPASEVEELAGLLADPVANVRLAAVHCVAALGGPSCGPLLRLKTLLGDDDPNVLEACFDELVARDKDRYLPVIASYLAVEHPRVRVSAALALGQSRRPAALELLSAVWRQAGDLEFKRTLLIAIGLLQIEPAIEFLLGRLDGSRVTALDALTALSYCRAPRVREKVEAEVDKAGDPELRREFDAVFKT
jgi:HEAT repeat protein